VEPPRSIELAVTLSLTPQAAVVRSRRCAVAAQDVVSNGMLRGAHTAPADRAKDSTASTSRHGLEKTMVSRCVIVCVRVCAY
jgi:hypothetical protein